MPASMDFSEFHEAARSFAESALTRAETFGARAPEIMGVYLDAATAAISETDDDTALVFVRVIEWLIKTAALEPSKDPFRYLRAWTTGSEPLSKYPAAYAMIRAAAEDAGNIRMDA